MLYLALPYNDRNPAITSDVADIALIARHIFFKFILPELDFGFGVIRIFATFMSMPEAAMHKYSRFILGKHYIGSPRQVFIREPVSIAKAV